MAIGLIEIGLLGIALYILLRHYFTKNLDYWIKHNVPGPKPVPLFGNFKDVMLRRIHLADFSKQLYDEYPNEPAVGFFARSKPALLLKDPEVLKDVMIKSFPSFADRGVKIHEDIDPLSQHLVFLDPKRWKPLRRKLTPVFTSGKLKEMFYLINDCAEHFETYLNKLVAKGEPIECRELTAKFTTDVIGVCAFGLNMNALSEDESEFRKIGRSLFQDNLTNRARHLIRTLPHWIARLLKPIARNDKVINFFVNTLRETMDYRRKNNVRRNDFVDLLMDIKDHPEQVGEEEMTEMLLTAQAFVFFIAGFETSSTTMSNAMYELALNPDIQDKLREEVTKTFDENNGKLNYDTVKEMKYLDKVIKESLRKYPPGFIVTRKAVNDHTLEGTKITVPKGMVVFIPIYAIHHDPKLYPEPDKFDPERFDEESERNMPPMSYLPFGEGPRICIGKRFAQNQTKMGLAIAIRHFKFEVCDKTCNPYVKDITASALLAPAGGVWLKISKI